MNFKLSKIQIIILSIIILIGAGIGAYIMRNSIECIMAPCIPPLHYFIIGAFVVGSIFGVIIYILLFLLNNLGITNFFNGIIGKSKDIKITNHKNKIWNWLSQKKWLIILFIVFFILFIFIFAFFDIKIFPCKVRPVIPNPPAFSNSFCGLTSSYNTGAQIEGTFFGNLLYFLIFLIIPFLFAYFINKRIKNKKEKS